VQVADAALQPGDPFLNQGFDSAQQSQFDRHDILQLNVRFSRREEITLRDNRG